MHHPDIEEWLRSRAEVERLKKLEHKAAEAWFDTLTLEQREVFSELAVGYEGMRHLQERIRKARFEAEQKRESGKQ